MCRSEGILPKILPAFAGRSETITHIDNISLKVLSHEKYETKILLRHGNLKLEQIKSPKDIYPLFDSTHYLPLQIISLEINQTIFL